MTLLEAVEAYLAHRRTQVSANTLLADTGALTRLARLLGPVEVGAVTAQEIDRYVEDMADCRASSRNLRVRKVAQFFAWCQRRGWVHENPVERRPEREDPRDPMFIPPERFGLLLDNADNPRDRMVLALGLYLFLRSSEIRTLRVSDLLDDRSGIHTTQHKTAGRDLMPVSAELGRELTDYLNWYKPDGDVYLVPALRRVSTANYGYPGNGQFRRVQTRVTIQPTVPVSKPHYIVQRALAQMGLPVFQQGGHTLRRSGARALFDSLRAEQGVDGALQVVKSMLHHESVAMTERYLGVTPEREIRDARIAGQEMFATPTDAEVISLSSWRR